MRADQPPSNPEQWLLPLAVDELGDALDVVRALTDEADATAVAARAALEDDSIVDTPDSAGDVAVATAAEAADAETAEAEAAGAENQGSGGETGPARPQNLDSPIRDTPDRTPEPPVDAEPPAEPATDEHTTEARDLPTAAIAAEAAAAGNQGYGGRPSPARPQVPDLPIGENDAEDRPTASAPEQPEHHEPETIRIGGTPAAVAGTAAASAAAAAAATAATSAAAPAAATAAAPAPPDAPAPPPQRSGGGGDGGDRRHLLVAAAFVGVIALAVAAIAVILGTRSDSAHVAGPASTPTASSGSGFTMTLTAPPGSGGAKASASPKPSRAVPKPKPTPKATAKPAAVAGPECSGSGWQQRRLQSAISRLTYDYGRVGISVAAAPARAGVLAIGDKTTGVVTAYVRGCAEESAPLLAAAVADQMAQLIDLQVLTNSERVDWMRRRGFAGGTAWDPDGLIDYASVFTRWQVGPGFWRSSLAPPSASELEILTRWYAPN